MTPTRAAADRSHERHAGKGERGRGGDHRENVGIGLEVIGEDRGDDLRVAAEIIREQRADRPVDQAGGERFAVGRAPFALEIAARNSARGERLFLVVDGEGKEILAGLRLLGGDHRRQHRGFAPGGEHRAVRLTGDASGLEGRACGRTSRVLRVVCQTSFFILHELRMRKPAAHAARRSGSSSARRRAAGRSASRLRSCHDARLSHWVEGAGRAAARFQDRDAPNSAPRSRGARCQRRMPRRSMRVL